MGVGIQNLDSNYLCAETLVYTGVLPPGPMTLGTTTGLAMEGKRLYTWRLTFSHVRGPQTLGEDILTISHQTETTITGIDQTTPGTMAGIGRLE